MVPRITSKGKSFKGAGAYFLHDLGKAETAERVEFTYTVNMLTDDPEKAIKVMAWTAEHAQDLKEISGQKMTGRKAENPVYNYCLAWAPDQDPTREEMIALGLRSMEALGAAKHEALFVAHSDTPHRHLHVILNRVDPETGLMAKMAHDKNLLSRLAQAYEEETGRVYCPQRVANNQRRDLGEQNVKAADVDRLAETPEYQERRAARLEAQREAGALALDTRRAEQAKATQGRDLRAAFDQAASTDDRQYRAKDIQRDPVDEKAQARTAWADELATQKAIARQAEAERREKARRAALDDKRAKAWDAYETGRWQVLNDRHTSRREALHDRHAAAESVFDTWLAKKYAPNETSLQRRREAAEAILQERGVRKVLAGMTGKRAKAEWNLDALQKAGDGLQAQKDRERAGLSAKLAAQREVDRLRQEQERRREAEKLQLTKARQDAAFEQKERERAERLKGREAAASAPNLEREAQQLAERAHVRGVGEQRVHNVEISEATGQSPRPTVKLRHDEREVDLTRTPTGQREEPRSVVPAGERRAVQDLTACPQATKASQEAGIANEENNSHAAKRPSPAEIVRKPNPVAVPPLEERPKSTAAADAKPPTRSPGPRAPSSARVGRPHGRSGGSKFQR